MNRLALKNVELNSKFKRVFEEIRKCVGPEPKPVKSLERMQESPLGFGCAVLPGVATLWPWNLLELAWASASGMARNTPAKKLLVPFSLHMVSAKG